MTVGNLTQPPVVGYPISQLFGSNPTANNPDPTYGNYQPAGHDGIDFACNVNTPIYAPGSGRVDYAGTGQGMPPNMTTKWGFVFGAGGWPSGNLVCIDHGAFGTYTAHMNGWNVQSGWNVGAGQFIGPSGNTGRSGGPHVHWSLIVWPTNYSDPLYSRRNPLAYLPAGYTFALTYGGGASSFGAGSIITEDELIYELMGQQ